MNLIDKYEPKKLTDLVGHKDQIKKILEIYQKNPYQTVLVVGPSGCGKSLAIKLIFQELGFKIKTYDTVTNNNENLIQEMINLNHNNIRYQLNGNKTEIVKTALVINNFDRITLSNEKLFIDNIIEYNSNKNTFPLVLIANSVDQKSFDYSNISRINFSHISRQEIQKYIEYILKEENVTCTEKSLISQLLDFSQKDMRRLMHILNDLLDSSKELTKKMIDDYIHNSQKKGINRNLFDSLKEVLISYEQINKVISIYNTEKVLLPLTFHENYAKDIFHNSYSLAERTKVFSEISELISKGDMIETDIYMDQYWELQETHCFFSVVKPVHILSKVNKYKSIDDIKYPISFSSELNKTSLKNINRKNINNLNNCLNTTILDMLSKTYLLNQLLVKLEYKKVSQILDEYTNDKIKIVEIIIKIDKCGKQDIVLNTKIKKMFA